MNNSHLQEKLVSLLFENIAYILTDQELYIKQESLNFTNFLAIDKNCAVGCQLTDVLWEFIGLESDLKTVIHEKTGELHIPYVNRQHPNQPQMLLDFHATSHEVLGNPGLLIVIEDRSQEYNKLWSMVQKRNEYGILNEQLNMANRKLEELDHFKTSVLALTSTDLTTPISLILGNLELAKNQISQEQNSLLSNLESAIDQATLIKRLIDELENLPQMIATDPVIDLLPWDLRYLFAKIKKNLCRTHLLNSFALNVHFPAKPVVVDLDFYRFEQLLFKILTPLYLTAEANGGLDFCLNSSYENQQAIIEIKTKNKLPTDSVLQIQKMRNIVNQYLAKQLLKAQKGEFNIVEDSNQVQITISLPWSKNQTFFNGNLDLFPTLAT